VARKRGRRRESEGGRRSSIELPLHGTAKQGSVLHCTVTGMNAVQGDQEGER
jgi:hypothetical protein